MTDNEIHVGDDFWEELYAKSPKPLQEGEKTVPMVARDMTISRDTAKKLLERWTEEGLLEHVGKRLVLGKPVDAWRQKPPEKA